METHCQSKPPLSKLHASSPPTWTLSCTIPVSKPKQTLHVSLSKLRHFHGLLHGSKIDNFSYKLIPKLRHPHAKTQKMRKSFNQRGTPYTKASCFRFHAKHSMQRHERRKKGFNDEKKPCKDMNRKKKKPRPREDPLILYKFPSSSFSKQMLDPTNLKQKGWRPRRLPSPLASVAFFGEGKRAALS